MTFERTIARTARDLVAAQKAAPSDRKHEKESAYRVLCESFPILLRTSGLAQALEFLRTKGERQAEYGVLYGHFQDHFRTLGLLQPSEELEAEVLGLERDGYRLYMQVALRVALWHKRLAQGELRKKEA